MAITFTVDSFQSTDQSSFIVEGALAFTGNYVTGGDTLNFQNAVGAPGLGADAIKSSLLPHFADIIERPVAGTSGTGYTFLYCAGTNQTNCAVQIFNGTTQLAAGAYPAGITGAVIRARFEFLAFL